MTGPLNPLDYIDIIEEGGTRTNSVQSYSYLRDGLPAQIRVPVAPGRYTLRYVEEIEGRAPRILASQPLEVTDLTYALTAPETAMAGSTLSIGWTGPNAQGDYIDVIEAGATRTNSAAADDYLTANPLPLILPLTPGAYEIRYIAEGPEGRVVAMTRPLTVTPPMVTLTAPATLAPGAEFTVQWQGPANPRSWIDIVVPGNAEFSGELTYAYLDPASPQVTLYAPTEAGSYELRFVAEDMRMNRQVLARVPLSVAAGAVAPSDGK
ncbi:hypothetical protein [Pararhodobacter zhoushanensis]|uniref:Ca-activated chloride channel family protein n=1 Tax=Pararhodobacter zhoushanensis TaxID=2479545 RepID=A0ABT3GYH8_9RHOB|nr:hypothetical protein [Pararhodobacter zhoushanensis]MCW1932545.1 hypothetical protein [Pararhodobacter zhoushanensis]